MNEQNLKIFKQGLWVFTFGYIVGGSAFSLLILSKIVEPETLANYGIYLLRILNLDVLRDLF